MGAVTAHLPVGIEPQRTADPAEAAALMARDGAAVLVGRGVDEDAAAAVAVDVVGDRLVALPPPTGVREGAEGDKGAVASTEELPLHTDGFSYGDRVCDAIFLLCAQAGRTGGESFLADGWAVVAAADPELRAFLHDEPVDLTEPGMHPIVSPVVRTLGNGRSVIRRTPFMTPAPDAPDPDRTAALIERYRALTRSLAPTLPRFRIEPGEALCVDNYRVLHGRAPYTGERFLWRVWAWTTDGAPPPDGELHSDSRYAVVDAGAAARLAPTMRSEDV